MWQNYFSKDSLIVGMDVNPECSSYIYAGENIEIFIGDQSNKEHLSALVKKYGKFDIIIDDGSHRVNDQIKSLEIFYPYLKNSGKYFIEDIDGDSNLISIENYLKQNNMSYKVYDLRSVKNRYDDILILITKETK